MNIKKFYKHKNWYRKTRSLLIKKYGKNYKLYAGLLASTSPRYHLKRNFRVSDIIYIEYQKNGLDFITDFTANEKISLKKYGILKAHYNNIIRVLDHNFKSKKPLTLSGLKVNSFFNNLIGNYNFVTLDVWTMRYFNHDKIYFNVSDYKKYTRIIRKLSEKLKIFPCECQAILWEKIRYQYKQSPSNFHSYLI